MNSGKSSLSSSPRPPSNMPQMTNPTLNSMIDFQKMVFIYNAVNDGWTVKQLPDDRYEFRKNDDRITSDECLDDYLRKFIKYYMMLKKENNPSSSSSPT